MVVTEVISEVIYEFKLNVLFVRFDAVVLFVLVLAKRQFFDHHGSTGSDRRSRGTYENAVSPLLSQSAFPLTRWDDLSTSVAIEMNSFLSRKCARRIRLSTSLGVLYMC